MNANSSFLSGRPSCLLFFHDEEINCRPHLPRSLTRRGRALSVVEHKAVPRETPRDSLYARISTYHCMEAARPCVGAVRQIVVCLRCAAQAFQSFQLRKLQSICQWLGIQGLLRSLSFVQNITATIAIVELLSYWIDHHFTHSVSRRRGPIRTLITIRSFFVASMSWQVQ